MASIGCLKRRAILKASGRLGSYFSVSTAFFVILAVGDFSPKVFFPALIGLAVVTGGLIYRLARLRARAAGKKDGPAA